MYNIMHVACQIVSTFDYGYKCIAYKLYEYNVSRRSTMELGTVQTVTV